jgi:hypothetical protein
MLGKICLAKLKFQKLSPTFSSLYFFLISPKADQRKPCICNDGNINSLYASLRDLYVARENNVASFCVRSFAMIPAYWRRVFVPILLSLVLLVSACSATKPPSQFEQTQQETSKRNAPAAVAKGAASGGTFNKFFPDSASGYDVVPAQEKNGFAEYKLNKGGKNVAVLSISDTAGNPTAVTKFQNSTTKIGGYPAVQQGANVTAVLVNDRYQVKVQSRDASFTAEDRTAWVQKFNLRGLAKLPAATSLLPKVQSPTTAAPTIPGKLQPAANPT